MDHLCGGMGSFLRRPGTGIPVQEAVSAGRQEELALLRKARPHHRAHYHNRSPSLSANRILPAIMGQRLQVLDNPWDVGLVGHDLHRTILRALEEPAA